MIELKNVPKKIYLQMTETEMFGDFLEHDVTWSEDRINDSDIEYVRVQPDPVKAQMLEALKKSRRKHYYCEDSWYSCPKSGEGCSNDEAGDNCNCGTDEWNNYVDKIIEAAEKEERK